MSDYKTIVAGTDGSGLSLLAVEHAASIVAALDVTLVIGCAYYETAEDASKTLRQGSVQILNDDPAQKNLATAKEATETAGITRVETEVCSGSSIEALIPLVTDCHADLLVVGDCGINSLIGRLLGSVLTDVARRSDCDVTIVHTVS